MIEQKEEVQKVSSVVDVYQYDEDNYFERSVVAQTINDDVLMPPRSTTVKPPEKEGFYFKWTGETWLEEKKPESAEECVKFGKISHESQTTRSHELRKLFETLTEGRDDYRLGRGEDLSWFVEVIPPKTPRELQEEKEKKVRMMRDQKLRECDYLIMPDYPLSEEKKDLVRTYRQALRDVPQQENFPNEVVWPEKPALE